MVRLFVGIDVGDLAKNSLTSLCYGISKVRWSKRENLHLTLSFIGEVDNVSYREIISALDEVDASSINLNISGVGAFSRKGSASSIYADLKKDDALNDLHKKTGDSLIGIGLKIEKRVYKPHITLGRCKGANSNEIAGFLSENALFKISNLKISEFVLYSSKLTEKGAIYQIEERFSLNSY